MAAGKVAKRSAEVAKKQSSSSSSESDYVKSSSNWNPCNLVPVRKLMVWTKQTTKQDENIKVRFSIQNNVYVGQKFAWKVCIDDNHYKVSPRFGILHPGRPQIITVTCAPGVVERISKDWLEIVFRTTQFNQVDDWDEYWKAGIKSPKTDGLIVGLKFVSDLTGQIFFETLHTTGQSSHSHLTTTTTTTMRLTRAEAQPTNSPIMRFKKGMLRHDLFSSEDSCSNKTNQSYQSTNHRTKRTKEYQPVERQPTQQSMEGQPKQEKDPCRRPMLTKCKKKQSWAGKSSKASIEPENKLIATAEEVPSSSSSNPSVIVRTKIPVKGIADKQITMNEKNTEEKLKISDPVKVAHNRSPFLKIGLESNSNQDNTYTRDEYSFIKSEEAIPKNYHTGRIEKGAHLKTIYSESSSEKQTPIRAKTSHIKPEEEFGSQYNQSKQAMKKLNKKEIKRKKRPRPVKQQKQQSYAQQHRVDEAEEEFEQVPLKGNFSSSDPSLYKRRKKFLGHQVPDVILNPENQKVLKKSPHEPITSETAFMQGQSTMVNVRSRMNTSMEEPKGFSPYPLLTPPTDRRKSADRPPYFEPWEESSGRNQESNESLVESPKEEFPSKTRRRRKQEKSEDVPINYSKSSRVKTPKEDVEAIGNVKPKKDSSTLNTTTSNPSTRKPSKILFWRKKQPQPVKPQVVEPQAKPRVASSVDSFSSIASMEETQFKATKNQQNREKRRRSAERSVQEFPNKINYSPSNQTLNKTHKNHHSPGKARILKQQDICLQDKPIRQSESSSAEEGPLMYNNNYKTEKARGSGRENYIKAETKQKAPPSAFKSSNDVVKQRPVIVTKELVIKETPYKRHKSPPKITKNKPKQNDNVTYSTYEVEKRLKSRHEIKMQPKTIITPVKKEPTRTPTDQRSKITKQTSLYRKTRYSKSSSDDGDYDDESTGPPTNHMKY